MFVMKEPEFRHTKSNFSNLLFFKIFGCIELFEKKLRNSKMDGEFPSFIH